MTGQQSEFKSRCVTITGGTGSFGSAFTRFLLDNTDLKVRIYSRDEHKQEDMARDLRQHESRLTFIIGDVRDVDRLTSAVDGCDFIVHAAALKTVPAATRNADEFVKTNVVGSSNVVQAAIAAGVKRSILISSDKACAPFNDYGKSKAVAEGLFIQGNLKGATRRSLFTVVRGGNVWSSRGSVAEVWGKTVAAGSSIRVDDPNTTRFHLPMDKWVYFVWNVLSHCHGGEIFVPHLRAWRLGDLAWAFSPDQLITDRRSGDKPCEVLISSYEAARALDLGWAYVIEPSDDIRHVWNYVPWSAPSVPAEWEYTSRSVDHLTIDELKQLIRGES